MVWIEGFYIDDKAIRPSRFINTRWKKSCRGLIGEKREKNTYIRHFILRALLM
jgi:hypothetical protein